MSFFCKVLAAHPKKRKRVEGSEKDGSVDIISQLPDSLLHHILSFLPTDLAVSTSILSKRWKYLWMYTTNLDFYGYHCSLQGDWPKFIEQVLRYHSSNITRFNLTCYPSFKFNTILVESWLSAAVQRQVKEIHLFFECLPVLSLPASLCTSKILRVLEVKAYSADLCLPLTIGLPSLKILHLENVKFMDDLSFARLFRGLPCIEELKINRCDWDNIKNAAVSLPTLRRLTFNDGDMTYGEHHGVNITAENLLRLNIRIDLDSVECTLDTMPSLAHAKVKAYMFYGFGPIARAAQCASNLFGALCFVKSLHLAGQSLEFLDSCCTLENINIFPMFVRLTTLRIECKNKISRSAAALLMTIFQNAPLLESLVVEGEVCGGKWSKKPHPHCIEFCLKKCCLWSFYGRRGDILFLKFLLKTATTLEELKIHCHSSLWKQRVKLKDIKNKLESVRRASECCVVEFLNDGY